ncbi:adenylate cyclase [Halalkalibacillus sediminis]|uniref:Adenylate cyclase n=1 Tax=Halalkalibacillus sediminis TaxID=2018042 RepID=A0A2I0QVI4_9BACI|nr:CYTH domain-containing protein [Halalkalibacillus sediminis]PKR78353.1 adenylate cyclase [Halalkalibacillus sediminis]
MQELEIEFKNLLTKEEYQHIADDQFQNPDSQKKQTNYYFETDDFFLKENKCALRIRKKDHKYVATLKQPRGDGLLETHDRLSEKEADSWFNNQIVLKENIKKQLSELNVPIHKIKYKGALVTHRLEKQKDDFIIVLDRSEYSGKVDYELEIEAKTYESGLDLFNSWLKRYQIPKRTTQSKIQRFFMSL